jgi:hypothetical protein
MALVDTTLLLQLEAVFGSMLTSALQLLDRREGAIFDWRIYAEVVLTGWKWSR